MEKYYIKEFGGIGSRSISESYDDDVGVCTFNNTNPN